MKYLSTISAGILAVALALPASAADSTPNVLFIMADDLGFTGIESPIATDGHGSKYHQTPNLNKFAEQGMSFVHAYTQQNCQPTRTALISGQYATGKYNNTYNVNGLNRQNSKSPGWPNLLIEPYKQTNEIDTSSTSMLEMFKNEGYETSWFGKNHGTGADEDLPEAHGVDYNVATSRRIYGMVNGKKKRVDYFAIQDGSNGWTLDGALKPYAQPYTKEYIAKNLEPFANGNDPSILEGTKKHYTDALTDALIDYLGKAKKENKKFAAYVPYHAVHTPIVPRDDLNKKYKKYKTPDERHTKPTYAAFVELLDQNIGRIMKALDELGLADNTLVIFTSDNGGYRGFTNNAPLRKYKGTFYEGGLRVPFIARWPGKIAPKTVSKQPVHIVDMYATFADVVDADTSKIVQKLDGESIIPVLTGKQKQLDRDTLFWHFPGYMDSRNWPRTLVQQRFDDQIYKLIFNYETGVYELYNITKDISESKNLMEAPTSADKKIALAMNKSMVEWLTKTNAPTGTWRVNGDKVPYPTLSLTNYPIPSQEGLESKDKKAKKDKKSKKSKKKES